VVATRQQPTSGAEVLLLKRTAARGGFWQPVTGRVEPGESEAQAAARELKEETGASGAVVDLAYEQTFAWGENTPPRLARAHAFAADWPGGEVRLDAAEHDAFAWLSPQAALERVPFAGLREAVRRAVSSK